MTELFAFINKLYWERLQREMDGETFTPEDGKAAFHKVLEFMREHERKLEAKACS